MTSSAASLPARQWIPALLCLGALVPAILIPTLGFLFSLAIMVAVLAVMKSSRQATLAMVWKKG